MWGGEWQQQQEDKIPWPLGLIFYQGEKDYRNDKNNELLKNVLRWIVFTENKPGEGNREWVGGKFANAGKMAKTDLQRWMRVKHLYRK